MTRFLFAALAALLFFSNPAFAQKKAPAKLALKDPEPFAKEVFAALKSGKSLDDYRILPKHKTLIIDIFIGSPEAEREGMTRERFEAEIEEHYARYEKRFQADLEELREAINWKKAELMYVLYEVEKHGENMFEGEIEITFEYEGEEWKLDLDESILLPDGWKLADHLDARKAEDEYDWSAEEYMMEEAVPAEEWEEAAEEVPAQPAPAE